MTIGNKSENLDASTQRKVETDAAETATTTTCSHNQNAMNFSGIPAHVSQILHVCAAHKKPRKLVTTLQKIRKDEGRQKGLCLVFFARIKTLQYIHNLLNQEGTSFATLCR
jgi:superfamily II DNA/RNA helicase